MTLSSWPYTDKTCSEICMHFITSLTNTTKYNTFSPWSVLSYKGSGSKIPLLLISHNWLQLVTYYSFPPFTLTLQFSSFRYKPTDLTEVASWEIPNSILVKIPIHSNQN